MSYEWWVMKMSDEMWVLRDDDEDDNDVDVDVDP
jgi:hypothetical protein